MQTTKATLPTTPIVPKKVNPNSLSAIMKQKKSKDDKES